jgi:hypothetical protein
MPPPIIGGGGNPPPKWFVKSVKSINTYPWVAVAFPCPSYVALPLVAAFVPSFHPLQSSKAAAEAYEGHQLVLRQRFDADDR